MRTLKSRATETLCARPSFPKSLPPPPSPNTAKPNLDTWLGTLKTGTHRKPRSRVRDFVAATAAAWTERITHLSDKHGGNVLALTVQAPKATPDDARMRLIVNLLAALAHHGAEVLGAIETRDACGHLRRLHGHFVVRTSMSRDAVHALALAAGGYRCTTKAVTDLPGWCSYICKNVREHTINDCVLTAGAPRLHVGSRVLARALVPIPRATRPRRTERQHGACLACGKALAGRSHAATCSTTCRVRVHRQQRREREPAGYAALRARSVTRPAAALDSPAGARTDGGRGRPVVVTGPRVARVGEETRRVRTSSASTSGAPVNYVVHARPGEVPHDDAALGSGSEQPAGAVSSWGTDYVAGPRTPAGGLFDRLPDDDEPEDVADSQTDDADHEHDLDTPGDLAPSGIDNLVSELVR